MTHRADRQRPPRGNLALPSPRAVLTKDQGLGGVNNGNLFSLGSGGWKVQDLGSDKMIPGEGCLPSLPMATISLCAHIARGERAIFHVSSFYKDPGPPDQGPILRASLKLNSFLKGPISKYSHIDD